MRYYKMLDDDYIVAVGCGCGGEEITAEEYQQIITAIENRPEDPTGYQYQLRNDNLEWDLNEAPEPIPVEEDAEPSDYEQALQEMGVDFND